MWQSTSAYVKNQKEARRRVRLAELIDDPRYTVSASM